MLDLEMGTQRAAMSRLLGATCAIRDKSGQLVGEVEWGHLWSAAARRRFDLQGFRCKAVSSHRTCSKRFSSHPRAKREDCERRADSRRDASAYRAARRVGLRGMQGGEGAAGLVSAAILSNAAGHGNGSDTP